MPFHRSCQQLSWEMAQNLKLDNTRLDWKMWKSDIWPRHLNKFKINIKYNIFIQWIKEMWISSSGGYRKKWYSPNTGTNLHNWVLGFTRKKINSSLQQKRISDEFLILGVSSVCQDSTSQAESKNAHKMARREVYIVDQKQFFC